MSRELRTINHGLRRPLVNYNSKNTASATEVAWRGYWPFLFSLVLDLVNHVRSR